MTQKLSKLTKSAIRLSRYEQLFTCPICQSQMKIVAQKSLICHQSHTFDIARQGYIHLLTRSMPSQYDKELFVARRKVIVDSDLFSPLTNEITKLIDKHAETNADLKIIDMGTGEGSHLHNICQQLKEKYGKECVGFGLDISKAGIMEAAKHYEAMSWLVADIANSPFIDNSFEIILNVLSPANYQEFKRLLRQEGVIIKIVPGRHYLKELRQFFYQNREQQEYSNEKVVSGFKENFQVIDHRTLTYQTHLSQPMLRVLINMTPLTWHASKEKIQRFLDRDHSDITVNVEIFVGKQAKA